MSNDECTEKFDSPKPAALEGNIAKDIGTSSYSHIKPEKLDKADQMIADNIGPSTHQHICANHVRRHSNYIVIDLDELHS